VIDFGALPPEVNSGRMYAGPGAGSLTTAASSWQALASQLESVGDGYSAVVSELVDRSWTGTASSAMATAAAHYVAWSEQAAAAAEQAAGQARAAAAAFERAHAATVPPVVVAENRLLYRTLVAANLFGHYTAQVAAVESEYAVMWAQDAEAMYGYAASSSAATALTPFHSPPHTTSAEGQAAAVGHATATATSRSALSQLISATPSQLQSLAAAGSSASTSADTSPLLSIFSDVNTLSSPANLGAGFTRTFFGGGSFLTGAYRSLIQAKDLPKIAAEDAARAAGGAAKAAKAAAVAPLGSARPVLAGLGRSAPVGGLSAPQSWAQATPAASAVEEPQWLSEADLHAAPVASEMTPGASPVVGMNPSSSAWGRATVSNVLRVPSRGFKMPRPSLGG